MLWWYMGHLHLSYLALSSLRILIQLQSVSPFSVSVISTLCDPMDCSMPGFPIYHQLPELAQTHVIKSLMPSNHLILCCPLLLLPSTFPNIRVFSNESILCIGDQSTGVSALTSILPMNIQDWLYLGLTGLIFLKSKGLSRVFSNTTVQKHQFFDTQLSLSSNSHTHTWLLEKP